MGEKIPVVDFSFYSNIDEGNFNDSNVEINKLKLSQEIYDAFTTVGFIYIKNHGIPESEISRVFQVGQNFFKLPSEEKRLFSKTNPSEHKHGYVAVGVEVTDPSKPVDSKEAFDVTEPFNNTLPWPSEDCSDFKPTVCGFFDNCKKLTLRILDLISVGLKLEDRNLLARTHEHIGTLENMTTLRLLYYPVMTGLQEGQLRLGEHSDYGTITLLFQDQIGGLELLSQEEFVPARPIEGTILVNIGDLLQRWTNDKLVSTRHRVVVPREELLRLTPRQSVAFFVHADNDVIVECLDGSGHYPAMSAKDYLLQRLSATYL